MKRSPQLEPLSHDHFEGLVVAGRLEKGLQRGAADSDLAAYMLSFWRTHLARHFNLEEEFLLPLLTAHGLEDLADRLRVEHRQIEDVVEELDVDADADVNAGAGSGTKATVRELAQLMRAHIRFEERELFPTLEDSASTAELDEVGRRLERDKPKADLGWDPAFWE